MPPLSSTSRSLLNHNLAEAALAYAQRGWCIFPVRPGLKSPLTKNGFLAATTDLVKVEAWWTKWPSANIGFRTDASTIAVVDVDAKNDGFESLKRLKEEVGEALFGDARLALSPNGQHFYYRDGANSVGRRIGVRPGIDVIAGAGYIIAPPSLRSDGSYRWAETPEPFSPHDLAPIPTDLLSHLLGATKKPQPHLRAVPAARRYGGSKILAGERNVTLTKIAGSLANHGLSHEDVIAILKQANLIACEEPLADDEIQKTIGRSVEQWRRRFDAGRFLWPWFAAGLSVNAVKLLTVLAISADANGVAAPNRDELQAKTGLSRTAYYNARAALEQAGALVCHFRGSRTSTAFVLQQRQSERRMPEAA